MKEIPTENKSHESAYWENIKREEKAKRRYFWIDSGLLLGFIFSLGIGAYLAQRDCDLRAEREHTLNPQQSAIVSQYDSNRDSSLNKGYDLQRK